MTRILIADDSQSVRCGLRTLLGLNADWEVCGEAVEGADAADGWRTSGPRNRQIWHRHPDPALHSESFTSTHGIGSQRWVAGRDFKVGNQQVTICDHGASVRRDLLLFDLNGGVSNAPEVG
jgi:hypothetical protein